MLDKHAMEMGSEPVGKAPHLIKNVPVDVGNS
jgi:hypothetical protein